MLGYLPQLLIQPTFSILGIPVFCWMDLFPVFVDISFKSHQSVTSHSSCFCVKGCESHSESHYKTLEGAGNVRGELVVFL